MKAQKKPAKRMEVMLLIAASIVLIALSLCVVLEIDNWTFQLDKGYDTIANNPQLTILERTIIRIKAKMVIDEENAAVLLNIPYDINWKIQVDGNNAVIMKTDDSMLAVHVNRGAHIIEIQYQPEELFLYLGLAVVVLVFICLLAKKKKAVPEVMEEDTEETLKTVETEEIVEAPTEDLIQKESQNDDLWEFMA